MKTLWTLLVTSYQVAKWLQEQKKAIERDAEAYFSDTKAAQVRLDAEKVFRLLEKGNGDLAKAKGMWARLLRWVLGATTVDNVIGRFGMKVLKSEKLEKGAKVLDEPGVVYPCH